MVKYNNARIKEVIANTFTEAQHSKACHSKLMQSLKKTYDACNFEVFVSEFIRCLKFALVIIEKSQKVENTFAFAAQFAVSLQPKPSEEDEIEEDSNNPFLQKLLDFCLQHHAAVDIAVRYRTCYFINLLLKSMSDEAFLSNKTWDEIDRAMTERVLDKSPKVRVQAIGALHRMQDPTIDQCPTIQIYIYHMSKDPSAEVRKAAIEYSAKTHKVLQAVMNRICDIDESVRKEAYVFFSKITVRSLTIKQRQLIVKTGLNDSSESVRKTVKDVILSAWLGNYQNDYCELLLALDTEMNIELGILVLNTLFERENPDKLFKKLAIDRDAKLIPIDQINSDKVLYWRCFIEYVIKKSLNELLEESIPELTTFCNYIRDFQKTIPEFSASNDPDNEEIKSQKVSFECIHLQLFEMIKTYDLSDEVGRANLRQLIEDTLMSETCSVEIIECIVKYYEVVVPDVSSRLTSLAHVISEIRMPTKVAENLVEEITDEEITERLVQCQKLKNKLLQRQNDQYLLVQAKKFAEADLIEKEMEQLRTEIKELSKAQTLLEPQTQEEEKNDPETMIKCLTIMFTMVQAASVKTLSSTLRSLFDNLAIPSVDHVDERVQALALKAMGVCLFLDGELARKHIMVYLVVMTADHDNLDLWLISLRVIFDMFLRYGLDHFNDIINIDKSVNSSTMRDTSKRNTKLYSSSDDTALSLEGENGDQRNNLIKILLDLINHLDRDVRTTAIGGFCKLLLHGKITNNSLLSSLIIRLFDPVTAKDVELRGSLLNFFKTYPYFTPGGSKCLQQAFIPTMKKLIDAPYNSSLEEVDPFNVAKFIVDLTSSQIHKAGRESCEAHNQLALDILKELVDEDSEVDGKTLIKLLKYLVIRCDNEEIKNRMKEAVDKVVEIVNPRERSVIKSLEMFRKQFEEHIPAEETHKTPEPEEEPFSQEQEVIEEDNDDEPEK